jgi:hypothetical protein
VPGHLARERALPIWASIFRAVPMVAPIMRRIGSRLIGGGAWRALNPEPLRERPQGRLLIAAMVEDRHHIHGVDRFHTAGSPAWWEYARCTPSRPVSR